MRERAEGQDEGTERIARDGKQDEEQKARRDEMMRGKNCRLLANLPTCLLANLPTCLLAYYTYYAFHSVPSSSHPRSARQYERRGGFFSSARLIRRVRIPNIPRRFPQLILSDISPSVCNEIFFYLTVAMLNTKKQCYIENRRQDHADEAIRHGQSKAHRPPTTNHFIIGSSPNPAGGGPYEGTQARESPRDGVGRYQMMVDIFNRLVSYLLNKQASKKKRDAGSSSHASRSSSRIFFVSLGVSSLSIEPGEIDTAFYRLSGRIRYVSLLVRKWKMPSSNCTLHTPPSPGEYSNCST